MKIPELIPAYEKVESLSSELNKQIYEVEEETIIIGALTSLSESRTNESIRLIIFQVLSNLFRG